MNQLDLDALAVLAALGETRSFTAAAKKLGTNKATVSRSIARLESAVGAELVHRTTRSVALSTAGLALYERTAAHVLALRAAVHDLPEREEQPSGDLRLTAPVDLGVMLLPDVVARFALRYPAVRLDVVLTNEVVDLVGGGFDLAVRVMGEKPKDSSLSMRRLGGGAIALYASPQYVARRGALSSLGEEGHDFALHTAGRALWKKQKPKIVSNDFFFLRDVAKAGVAASMLPTFVGDPLVAVGELVRCGAPLHGPGTFALVYPSSGQVARKVTAFRDVLVEALRQRPLG